MSDEQVQAIVVELRSLRRAVEQQGATLTLLLRAVQSQGVRLSTLEGQHLTPPPTMGLEDP